MLFSTPYICVNKKISSDFKFLHNKQTQSNTFTHSCRVLNKSDICANLIVDRWRYVQYLARDRMLRIVCSSCARASEGCKYPLVNVLGSVNSFSVSTSQMGIQGLSKLIGDYAPSAVKENEIKNYFGK